jgi:uncharacterized protein YeaO (DUF488 family)
MAISIVRLGSPRSAGEGLRLGTVRRPPRGVPKEQFASRDFYDVWLPNLAPSAELMAQGRAAATDAEWKVFERAYRKEMALPDAAHVIDLLAALSHGTALAVGCYCEHEARCHRGILRQLLLERRAEVQLICAPDDTSPAPR